MPLALWTPVLCHPLVWRTCCLWLTVQVVASRQWPSEHVWKLNWRRPGVRGGHSLPRGLHLWLSEHVHPRLEQVVQGWTLHLGNFLFKLFRPFWEIWGERMRRTEEEIATSMEYWFTYWLVFASLVKCFLSSTFNFFPLFLKVNDDFLMIPKQVS